MYILWNLAYFQSCGSKAVSTGFYDSGWYQQEEGGKSSKIQFLRSMSHGGAEWEWVVIGCRPGILELHMKKLDHNHYPKAILSIRDK